MTVSKAFRLQAAVTLRNAFQAAYGANVSVDFGDPPIKAAVARAVAEVEEVLRDRGRWIEPTDASTLADLNYLEGYVRALDDFFHVTRAPIWHEVYRALVAISTPTAKSTGEIETRLGAALMKLPAGD